MFYECDGSIKLKLLMGGDRSGRAIKGVYRPVSQQRAESDWTHAEAGCWRLDEMWLVTDTTHLCRGGWARAAERNVDDPEIAR